MFIDFLPHDTHILSAPKIEISSALDYFQPDWNLSWSSDGLRTHCAMFRAATQTRPSVESVHCAVAFSRTGLHIASTGTAQSRCLPNQSWTATADVSPSGPAPQASAFCTIGLGGSFETEHPSMVRTATTINVNFIALTSSRIGILSHQRPPAST